MLPQDSELLVCGTSRIGEVSVTLEDNQRLRQLDSKCHEFGGHLVKTQ